jgi:hypothetical protein
MKPAKIVAILCILSSVFYSRSHAQENTDRSFKKGSIEFGGEYFRPSQSSGLFSSAGAGFVAINFRPWRNFQVDAVQVDLIASRTDRSTLVQFPDGTITTRQINSHPSLLTFGGRFVLPLSQEKVLLSAGGGWSGLQTSEAIQTNPNEQAVCFSCDSHRG